MTDTALIPWAGFDPSQDNLLSDACRDVAERLADGGWKRWLDIAAPVAASHGLQLRTVENLLRGMTRLGGIQQRRRGGSRRLRGREIRRHERMACDADET